MDEETAFEDINIKSVPNLKMFMFQNCSSKQQENWVVEVKAFLKIKSPAKLIFPN